MSDKAITQARRAVMKHFGILADDGWDYLKFYTKTINKTQMKVLSRLDAENVDIKRSGKMLLVIIS
tara:strand:+ start:1375 stop:1572 length:198 start_codon:yes stop_codon:yes gene_type:complete